MTGHAVDRLIELLDDPDSDVDATIDLADGIAASGDRGPLPRLEAELDRFIGERNPYARELLGGVIGRLGGAEALPVLLRASAHDLGDDQDGLATEIVDAALTDPPKARALLLPLMEDADPAVAARAEWALRFLPAAPDS
ncbi:HEAT repeat domain-containing protein [Streptomyces sp. NPDC000229]|uniref:HEAT repeat domain-containing protein n=1 Tax=Streptomyces sp. NPDC000229 TaxID=3154247 RepID=UPI003321DE19